MSKRFTRRKGFTVIELVVAIAIVGMLAALLLPAVESARVSARRLACMNHLRQMSLGLHLYHDAHACFPPGSYVMGPSFPTQSGWGWGAMILPSVDQGPLYRQIDFRAGTAVGDNLDLIETSVPLWCCPSDIAEQSITVNCLDHPPFDLASGNYCGSEGVLSEMSRVLIRDITDGTSRTLLLGERLVQPGLDGSLPFTSAWCGQVAFADDYQYRSVPHLMPTRVHPINASEYDPSCFGSRHAGGANFAFADGSIQFLNQNIDSVVFEAFGTAQGGEVLTLP